MAFPNVSDIVATTIESRTKTIADNVTKNNAVLAQLKKGGRIKTGMRVGILVTTSYRQPRKMYSPPPNLTSNSSLFQLSSRAWRCCRMLAKSR
jgi:hypothetical protein